MKLKKLLAAVTAAALAVTTMAVTSFTASAAVATVPEGTREVLASAEVSYAPTSAWDNGPWGQINNVDETWMTADNIYVEAKFSNLGGADSDSGEQSFDDVKGWATIMNWYNNNKIDGTDDLDTEQNFEVSFIACEGSTADNCVAYEPITSFKRASWGGISGNLQSGHIKGFTLVSLSIVKFTKDEGGNTGDDSSDDTLEWKEEPDGTYTISGAFPGGDGSPSINVDVEKLAVAAGKTAADIKSVSVAFTVAGGANGCIGGNKDGKWASTNWSADASTLTLTTDDFDSLTSFNLQYWYAEEGGSCKAVFTPNFDDTEEPGGDDPVDPPAGDRTYALIWEGSNDFGNWADSPVSIAAGEFSSLNAGDTIKFTYSINAVPGEPWNQIKIADSNDTVLASPTGKNEWDCVDLSSETEYSFVVSAADVELLKANGMKVTGHGVVLLKVELNPDKKPGSGDVNEFSYVIAVNDVNLTVGETVQGSASGSYYDPESGSNKSLNPGTFKWSVEDTSIATVSESGLFTAVAPGTTRGKVRYEDVNFPNGYIEKSFNVTVKASTDTPSEPSVPSVPSAPIVPSTSSNSSPVTSTTVVDTILATPDGGSGSVSLGSSTKLDKVAMEALATKGNVTVKFTVSGGAYWEINGENVTKAKAVDLGVKVNGTLIPKSKVEEFAGDKTTVQLTLKHNGDFGFTGVLNVPVGKANNGKFANLYYYHSGKFDFVGSSAIADGKAKFAFSHASNYLIVIDDYAYGEDVSSAAGMTETTETSAVPYVALTVAIAAFGTSAIVLKKRLSK